MREPENDRFRRILYRYQGAILVAHMHPERIFRPTIWSRANVRITTYRHEQMLQFGGVFSGMMKCRKIGGVQTSLGTGGKMNTGNQSSTKRRAQTRGEKPAPKIIELDLAPGFRDRLIEHIDRARVASVCFNGAKNNFRCGLVLAAPKKKTVEVSSLLPQALSTRWQAVRSACRPALRTQSPGRNPRHHASNA